MMLVVRKLRHSSCPRLTDVVLVSPPLHTPYPSAGFGRSGIALRFATLRRLIPDTVLPRRTCSDGRRH